MGLLGLGGPANPPCLLGTFCSRLSPRTTQNFPSNHRAQDYIIPCMAAELLPNRCQPSPGRLPSSSSVGAGGRPLEERCPHRKPGSLSSGRHSSSLACLGASSQALSCSHTNSTGCPRRDGVGRGNGHCSRRVPDTPAAQHVSPASPFYQVAWRPSSAGPSARIHLSLPFSPRDLGVT